MKRINIIAGHYGSGKTNIAVNLALKMKQQGYDVAIADLDIVNPYFRTKDSAESLKKADISLISSDFANSNVDLPAVPQAMYSVLDDKSKYYIVDLGGDDTGAYALGRYSEKIKEEDNYDFYFVFNVFRPLTRTANDAYEVMLEIEKACKLKFTAIINNSNIGELTTQENIYYSVDECKKLSDLSCLPIAFTSVKKDLYEKTDIDINDKNILPLELQMKII